MVRTTRKENPQHVALESLTAIAQQVDVLRAQLASYYTTLDTDQFPLVEQEVGDVLHAIRGAVKRLRKAKSVLAQEALPGMGASEVDRGEIQQ
jgi:hypothetical protein